MGGRILPPSLQNFASIKHMTMRLRGWIVLSKMFSLRSVAGSDNVKLLDNYVLISKWRPSWIRSLGFLISQKLERKVIKTKKGTMA